MDNCYQVIEEGGTFREFEKSHEGLEDAIECAWENCTDVVWKHDDVAETVWAIPDIHINPKLGGTTHQRPNVRLGRSLILAFSARASSAFTNK